MSLTKERVEEVKESPSVTKAPKKPLPLKKPKKKKRKNPFRFWFYDFVKITGGPLAILFFRMKVLWESDAAKARYKKGGYVFVANHTGYTDPIVAMVTVWYRRVFFMAKQIFFDGNAVKRAFFKGVHCIKVDTNNPGVASLKGVTEKLKDGRCVFIFPEGHVSFGSKEMDTFKSGAAMMAAVGRVPIVPMYILPRKKWYHRQVVVMGEAVYSPAERMLSLPEIEELTCRLQEKEYELRKIAEGWKNR